MGLKVQETTGLTREQLIVDKFKVLVKHHTRPEYDRIDALCAGKSPEEQAAIKSKAFLAGWTDCTPAALRRIGVALADDQPLDPKGCIPFDADTARDVWMLAHEGLFAHKLTLFMLRMLESIETEKELAKNGFGGSSQISTIP